MIKYRVKSTEILNDKIDYSQLAIDKIGGYPTHLPPGNIEDYGYFFMQIYNSEIIKGRDDILCWQFYQEDEFGTLTYIVEVPKGAEKNNKTGLKRRWLSEYLLTYEELDDNYDNFEELEEFDSFIGGEIPEEFEGEFAPYNNIKYVGVLYEGICDNEIGGDEYFILLGMNEEQTLVMQDG